MITVHGGTPEQWPIMRLISQIWAFDAGASSLLKYAGDYGANNTAKLLSYAADLAD